MKWIVLLFLLAFVLHYPLQTLTIVAFIVSINLFLHKREEKNSLKTEINETHTNTDNSNPNDLMIYNSAQNETVNYHGSKSINSYDGLEIGEIILMDWLENKKQTDLPPDYFSIFYEINYNISINKLASNNYIRTSTPSESLYSLKIKDLKEILKNNSLKVSGKKAELIKRIQDNVEEYLYANTVPKCWSLTNQGEKIIEKYHLLIWAHKNRSHDTCVTPYSVVPYLDSNLGPEEIAYNISKKSFIKNLKDFKYGMATNDLMYQHKLLLNENKLEEALYCVMFAIILQLTGLGNSDKDYIYVHKYNVYTSDLKAEIIKLQSMLSLSNSELEEYLMQAYKKIEQDLSSIRLFHNEEELLTCFRTLMYLSKEEYYSIIESWIQRMPDKYR